MISIPKSGLGIGLMLLGCLAFGAEREGLTLIRGAAAVTVDGRLDEPAWVAAPVRYLARFAAQAPLYLAELRLLATADALLVGFRCPDPAIIATQSARDARLWESDDVVELFLLPPTPSGRCIELQVNPRGAFLDIYHCDGATLEQAITWTWTGAAVAATVDAAAGVWEAELRLPLAALGDEAGGDGAWRVFACSMNRVPLGPKRLGREISYWPVPSEARTDQVAAYAELRLADAATAAAPIAGYQTLLAGESRRWEGVLADYRGLAPGWELDSGDPGSVLRWQTAALPATLPERVQVAWVGQGGKADPGKGRQNFELLVNDQPLLRFQSYLYGDTRWTAAAGDVTLTYTKGAGTSKPSGLYTLSLPTAGLQPGAPLTLAVRAVGEGPRSYFILKAWTDVQAPTPPAPTQAPPAE